MYHACSFTSLRKSIDRVSYHKLLVLATWDIRSGNWPPTYAPWLNPIEKVLRKLKQEILHLHRYSSRWKDLQEHVDAWLIQYDRPAPDLLYSVGLSPS